MSLTPYQEERRDRAEARADSLDRQAQAAYDGASAATAGIPMGQPILVGHHSEKRHRKALERSDRGMRKSCDLTAAANQARSSAKRAGSAISSDDPDAIEALAEKLAGLEAKRSEFKAHNKRARETGGETLPAYVLQNLGANIRRVGARLATLKAAASRPPRCVEAEGFKIEDFDNRVRFTFDVRPSPETGKTMKQNGFRWAPSLGAWVRHSNIQGRAAAVYVARIVFGQDVVL